MNIAFLVFCVYAVLFGIAGVQTPDPWTWLNCAAAMVAAYAVLGEVKLGLFLLAIAPWVLGWWFGHPLSDEFLLATVAQALGWWFGLPLSDELMRYMQVVLLVLVVIATAQLFWKRRRAS